MAAHGRGTARTDSIDRRAATVASFASLLAVLTATFGLRLVERFHAWSTVAVFVAGLAVLVASVGCAIAALWPREYLTLRASYVRSFPSWTEVSKPPEQVKGELMRTLVEALVRERTVSEGKLGWLRRSFALLAAGLCLIAVEASTLALEELRR